MADWKDILNDDERPLSEDDLLKYINVRTPAADKQQIGEIATDDFENDALEGLQQLQNPEEAKLHVAILKKQLHNHLRSKKQKKQKPVNKDMQWLVVATIVLLLTCVLAYTVIKLIRH